MLSLDPGQACSRASHLRQEASLPAPFSTKSAGNGPSSAKASNGFLPTAPAGFSVNVFAKDFKYPRFLAVAPNGDIFLADLGAGQVIVLRDPQHGGSAQQREVFVDKLNRPFGIAFHDDYVYVGNMNEVVRFRYDKQTSKRLGESSTFCLNWNTFSIFLQAALTSRAPLLSVLMVNAFTSVSAPPEISTSRQISAARQFWWPILTEEFADLRHWLRNAVGLGIEPVTGAAWVCVNERDELGDNLPPDFFTSVQDGGFYGWPYSYIGANVDPRVQPQKPDLVAKAIIPDVLLGAHVAPLEFTFYTGKQFPEQYRGGAFIAEHGSWNSASRAGYQVAFVGFKRRKGLG